MKKWGQSNDKASTNKVAKTNPYQFSSLKSKILLSSSRDNQLKSQKDHSNIKGTNKKGKTEPKVSSSPVPETQLQDKTISTIDYLVKSNRTQCPNSKDWSISSDIKAKFFSSINNVINEDRAISFNNDNNSIRTIGGIDNRGKDNNKTFEKDRQEDKAINTILTYTPVKINQSKLFFSQKKKEIVQSIDSEGFIPEQLLDHQCIGISINQINTKDINPMALMIDVNVKKNHQIEKYRHLMLYKFNTNPQIREKAAKHIQMWWKKIQDKKNMVKQKVLLLQTYWRGHIFRKNISDIITIAAYYQTFCDKLNRIIRHYVLVHYFPRLNLKKRQKLSIIFPIKLKQYFNRWKANVKRYQKIQFHMKKLLKIRKRNATIPQLIELYFHLWLMKIKNDQRKDYLKYNNGVLILQHSLKFHHNKIPFQLVIDHQCLTNKANLERRGNLLRRIIIHLTNQTSYKLSYYYYFWKRVYTEECITRKARVIGLFSLKRLSIIKAIKNWNVIKNNFLITNTRNYFYAISKQLKTIKLLQSYNKYSTMLNDDSIRYFRKWKNNTLNRSIIVSLSFLLQSMNKDLKNINVQFKRNYVNRLYKLYIYKQLSFVFDQLTIKHNQFNNLFVFQQLRNMGSIKACSTYNKKHTLKSNPKSIQFTFKQSSPVKRHIRSKSHLFTLLPLFIKYFIGITQRINASSFNEIKNQSLPYLFTTTLKQYTQKQLILNKQKLIKHMIGLSLQYDLHMFLNKAMKNKLKEIMTNLITVKRLWILINVTIENKNKQIMKRKKILLKIWRVYVRMMISRRKQKKDIMKYFSKTYSDLSFQLYGAGPQPNPIVEEEVKQVFNFMD